MLDITHGVNPLSLLFS
ncbi:CRISPR-associated DxTHG motif protein [Brevibacillus laterosporus]|nr:CRISPR-associated DxTHG motif protein [Brevibacillus laterosporus]TPH14565.1 CRISPR-associated DxTHG motif protein [Brevibacillus laterosporus]HAS01618.1 CRISPR-associated DxTHG motif protein [Brevibacillus sp.]